jgi:hypothetical protein
VWNRQRFFKDPCTGRRIAKPNPETDWIITTVPELRIISDELWATVKGRQSRTRNVLLQDVAGVRAERARRPSYLLSGLLKCGSCGGGFSKISAEHYGCSNARNRGICRNRLTIRRDVLEESVLGGLKAKLMHPDLVKEFVAEYYREINRAAAARDSARQGFAKELATVEREIREIIGAIKSGIRSATMAMELEALENRKEELQRKLAAKPEAPIRLHPNLADVYRRQVENLREALSREDAREEAVAILRGLIEQIRLEPVDGQLGIYLVEILLRFWAFARKNTPALWKPGCK